MASKGLTMADLRLVQAQTTGAVTTESLAASKGLPVDLLRRYGVKDCASLTPAERLTHDVTSAQGVWIPYHNADGTIAARTRLRTAHVAKDGSKWLGGVGAIQPYGLHELADAKAQGILCLCEGETDYWSLRAMGVPALGIPGAQMVRTLQRAHLTGVQALYICQDSDAAGASFVSLVRQAVASWGVPTVAAVQMPAGCKDVNDVYRKDARTATERFTELLQHAAAAAAPAVREFSTAGEIYTLTAPEWGLRLEADQLRRSSWGELTGELAVTADVGGDLFRGSINLSNVERRQQVALQIAKRSGLTEADWPGLLEDFAIRCLKAERTAGSVVNLQHVALPSAESTWDIDHFRLSQRDATCLFGDGGTGKSLLAVYLAGVLARQGVRVLYLDAEWEASIHKERLVTLFGPEIPPVLYLEQRRPLEMAATQIRRHLLEHQVEYLVLDSVGLLTVGAPEESGAALGFSRAVQSLGIGTLSLAHIRKPQGTNDIRPQDQKPFGSVFYHNLFRRTYFAKAEQDAPSPNTKRMVIWNPKWNHRGAGQKPFGIEVEDLGQETRIRPVDATDVDGLSDKLTNRQRLQAALQRGPQTAAALADELNLKPEAVERELRRGKDKWVVRAPVSGGSLGWELADAA